MKKFFKNDLFNEQFLRTIGHTYYGGADIGECFYMTTVTEDGNYTSWYTQWSQMADRLMSEGLKSEINNDYVSAWQACLRASNYYRNAYFFLRDKPEDPRIKETWFKSVQAFQKTASLFQFHSETIKIPYEDTYLHGYLIKPFDDDKKRPTIIITSGSDSTAEELWFYGGAAALQRGYNLVAFDGPGQGETLIVQKIPFRPDWEHVITPVVDFISSFKTVDTNNIALQGNSMGGYLASRAASGEHRLAALITDPGIYDLNETTLAYFPFIKEFPNLINQFFSYLFEQNRSIAFMVKSRMDSFKVKTPAEWLDKLKEYTLKDRAQLIKCPTLVTDNEDEPLSKGQAKLLYSKLTTKKEYLLFTNAEGASGHCEPLAHSLFAQKVFDWLSTIFKN